MLVTSSADLLQWMRLLLTGTNHFEYCDGRTVEIRFGLLTFAPLSDAERAELFVEWLQIAIGHTDIVALRQALRELGSIRDGLPIGASRSKLDLELRQLHFLLADEPGLRAELRNPPDPSDSFALSRRGADYLLLGEVSMAQHYYALARDRAGDGDAMYSALFGLWECSGWTSDSVRLRESIPANRRPRADRVWRFRRPDPDGTTDDILDPQLLIRRLTRFAVEARALGWPHSHRPRHSGPIEGVAKTLAKLELQVPNSEETGERAAIAWLLRVGAFEKDSLREIDVERLARSEGGREWAAEWCLRTFGALRMLLSHWNYKIRVFDLLDDRAIDDAVVALIEASLGAARRAENVSDLVSVWESLEQQAHRMPLATAMKLVGALPELTRMKDWRAIRWLDVVKPSLWPRAGQAGRRAVRILVRTLISKVTEPASLSDWTIRGPVLSAACRLHAAGYLMSADRQALCRVLVDGARVDGSGAKDGALDMVWLDLLAALLDLGVKPNEMVAKFGKPLARVAREAGLVHVAKWCAVAGAFAETLSGAQCEVVFDRVLNHRA